MKKKYLSSRPKWAVVNEVERSQNIEIYIYQLLHYTSRQIPSTKYHQL